MQCPSSPDGQEPFAGPSTTISPPMRPAYNPYPESSIWSTGERWARPAPPTYRDTPTSPTLRLSLPSVTSLSVRTSKLPARYNPLSTTVRKMGTSTNVEPRPSTPKPAETLKEFAGRMPGKKLSAEILRTFRQTSGFVSTRPFEELKKTSWQVQPLYEEFVDTGYLDHPESGRVTPCTRVTRFFTPKTPPRTGMATRVRKLSSSTISTQTSPLGSDASSKSGETDIPLSPTTREEASTFAQSDLLSRRSTKSMRFSPTVRRGKRCTDDLPSLTRQFVDSLSNSPQL